MADAEARLTTVSKESCAGSIPADSLLRDAELTSRREARLASPVVRALVVSLFVVHVALLAVSGAHAATYPGVKPRPLFATPGKAAYCYTDVAGSEDDRAELFCWRPNDGRWASIEWNGRRARTGIYDGFPRIAHRITKLKGYAPAARVLRFGERWRLRCDDPGDFRTCEGRGVTAFACSSARTGLTCRNAAEHGFWIGRYRGYRLF
jgi:hypothetical protein